MLFVFCSYGKNRAQNINNSIILLTENNGLLISVNSGDSWESFNKGLPADIIPLLIKEGPNRIMYLTTLHSGIFRLDNSDDKWKSINSDKFLKRGNSLILKKFGKYRKISAFAINRNHPEQIILSTKHDIYISYNRGAKWQKVSMKGLHTRNYVTALCVTGKKPVIYAGTSFKGIFKKSTGKFYNFSKGLPVEKYSRKVTFYEHVTDIKQSAYNPSVFAAFAFGRGLFVTYNNTSWKNLKLPVGKDKKNFIHSINSDNKKLYVSTDSGIYNSFKKNLNWKLNNQLNIIKKLPTGTTPLSYMIIRNPGEHPSLFYKIKETGFRIKKLNLKASQKKGIYTGPYSIRKKLDYYIKTIKNYGLNSLVIDMKDDFGYLYFPTKNKTALEIGSARRPLPVTRILKKLKDNNIYAIARLVVFKDRALFSGYGNKYSIINRRTGKPWKGNPREYWVDPHSDFVKDYNIEIAKELEKLGFDEIQFDYIRFPTDGPTNLCTFRYKKEKNIYKSEVLTNFLSAAKNVLKIPISVDIYGFNGWYYAGNWMGQDIEEFSYIVDVICPMNYPSHFGNRFYMKGPRGERPFRIIKAAGLRARRNSNNRVFIRPYLQGFNLISPTWSPGYIKNQVAGAKESNSSGFTFWNARGDYSMVRKGLK